MDSIHRRKKASVWLLFIPVAIHVVIVSINSLNSQPTQTTDFGLFVLLTIVIASFPVRTKDTVFNMVNGMSLATFIVFGLHAELLLSFVGILGVLIRSDIRWDQHYRYPLNILATWSTSIVSAGMYTLSSQFFGTGTDEPHVLISMAVYLVTSSLVNQLLFVIVGKYFYGYDDINYFDDKLVFSLRNAGFILPMSFIVIYLYGSLGAIGVILASFPFIIISVGTKFYYRSKSNNKLLTQITTYSQNLAKMSSRQVAIENFMDYILKIFPSKQIFYFKVHKEKFALLDSVSGFDGITVEQMPEIILTEKSPLMEAFNCDQLAVFDKASEWRNNAYHFEGYEPESAIVLPIRLVNKNRGLIIITHPHRKIYDEFLVTLIGIFYQYFRIVLDNVYEFEKIEDSSYTDYLTQLPNLRGFYKYFDEIGTGRHFDTLSLIVLDLDYFKKINDTYGHEGGNDVLAQVADVLKKFQSKDVWIARYGGEEFIILLQNVSKEEAFQCAEAIRKKIEETIFKIQYSIDSRTEEEVTVTASLGLAVYPDDVEDIHSLVKLADRAMYLGSKQTGRNKTTIHVEER